MRLKAALAKLPFYLMPGMGDFLWLSAFLSVVGLGPRMMNIDGDLGRHLTIGRWIIQNGRIPTTDVFSHTMAGAPLTPHEWLVQVIFAAAHSWLGLDGVILICGLVIATSFWLVFRLARAQAQGFLIPVVLTVLGMAASSLHWLSRPHVFTFLLLALWVSVLEAFRQDRTRRWWLLPLIMLPWANLHGAFIAGFATWVLFGIGAAWDTFWQERPEGEPNSWRAQAGFWRSFGLGGGAALLVTLINPSGIGLWGTSVGYVGNRYLVSHTAEYLPPNFHSPSTWPFLIMIGLLVVALGLQARKPPAAWALPAAAWLVMGLYSVRNVPLFVIVATPLLAGLLADWLVKARARLRLLDAIAGLDGRLAQTDLRLRGRFWPVLVVLLVILGWRAGIALDFDQRGNQFHPEVFPVQAVTWLADHPQPGEMFNYFPWGGYILYRAWPQQHVFIDGQTDFYGEALTRQYEQALTLSPGWEDVLAQYGVRWVILPPAEPLARHLRGVGGWHVVYEDDTAVILLAAP